MTPAIIGTAVPHDNTGKRLAVSVGATLIDAGAAPGYRFTRKTERAFSGIAAWGGGNVNNNAVGNRRIDFVHEGTNWECWQIIPFDAVVLGGVHGACRLQLRNRDKGRGQNLLSEMPSRVRLSGADWTGLPWSFTRTVNSSEFQNVGSGNAARVAVSYHADRDVTGLTPSGVGIANPAQAGVDGESFTIELFFD